MSAPSMISESELSLISGENPENSVIQRLVEGYRYACQNIKAELRLEVQSEFERALLKEVDALTGHLATAKTAFAEAMHEIADLRNRLRDKQLECIALMQSRATDLEKMNGALREEIMQVRSLYQNLNDIVLDYRRRYG